MLSYYLELKKSLTVAFPHIFWLIVNYFIPILLVSPAQADMNAWEPSTLSESTNHTVIVFDNRGVGNTTTGNRAFSIQQFANDTAGLLDALKIRNADVFGYSQGSLVRNNLQLRIQKRLTDLYLLLHRGGKESVPPKPSTSKNGY